MCLSSVYMLKNNDEKELLCKNIASVTTANDKLVFTNLMGIPTEFDGVIQKIDLIENCIYVQSQNS